jgi:ankyrin repeat protein
MDDADLTQQLVEAAAMGNLGKCKHLLKAGANVAKGDYDQRTPLHLAAAEGRLDLCKWLVEKGADVNHVDNFGRTPLEEGVLQQQDAVCAYLESQNARMEDSRVLGLLCEAAFDGDVGQCAKLTHRVSSSVRDVDYDSRSALHVAVCAKKTDVAEFLLSQGADPKCKDRWGHTAIDNAMELNLDELLPYLDGRMAPSSEVQVSPKRPAGQSSARDMAKIVPTTPNGDSLTAGMELMKMAASGNLSDLKNLMEKGADPAIEDYDKRTPLHVAAASGHAKVVKLLVKDKRVNINAVDRFKVTPLADAQKNKSKEVIEILKRNGATVTNSGYGFVLCGAAAKADIPKLEELFDSGVDLATADYDGRTALHLACCNGQVEVVDFLVKHLEQQALNVLDRMHNTALDDARNHEQDECEELLVSAGAVSRHGGDTPKVKKNVLS